MTIVVGYVPTSEGEAALIQAAQEAAIRHSDLVVVDLSRMERSDPAELKARVEQHAAPGTAVQVRAIPDGQDTVETVLKIVEDAGAGLVVIGLRRRTPVGKLILGAQAQRILLEAACPVLTVKPSAETGAAGR